MNILHTVEFYSPSVGGMQEVVRQLSERLVLRGHRVTVATTALPARKAREIAGVAIADFAITGNTVRGLTGDVERYQQFLLNSDFQIITNFAAQQWATDAMLPLLGQIDAKKVFVPTGFSALYQPEYANYFAAMPGWLHQYDLNVFLSETYRDVAFAREHSVTNRALIPNGAAADEFSAIPQVDIRQLLKIPRDHLLILHIGSHSGLKGHDAAIAMFRRARIEKAALLLVGDSGMGACLRSCQVRAGLFRLSPPQHRLDKRLIVTELSRSQTVAAFHAADLFLFPSQVECSPLVLFESMASRTPFLTTDAGNAAEIVAWTGGGKVLPTHTMENGYSRADIEKGSRLLEELASDAGARAALAEAGHAAWRERFTWETITEQYEAAYARLLEA